jgi:hypothetical protein
MVTRALLEMNRDIGRRLDGTFPPLHQEAPSPSGNAPPLPPAPKGIMFAKGFRLHEADMCGLRAAPDKPWTEQTRRQNAKTIELWIELFGDRPVDAYTRDDAVAFKRALEHLPKNHGKSPNDTRTMPEIVKAVANATRDEDDRLMWEADDLTKLFATPIWTGSLSPGRRSVPCSTAPARKKPPSYAQPTSSRKAGFGFSTSTGTTATS